MHTGVLWREHESAGKQQKFRDRLISDPGREVRPGNSGAKRENICQDPRGARWCCACLVSGEPESSKTTDC